MLFTWRLRLRIDGLLHTGKRRKANAFRRHAAEQCEGALHYDTRRDALWRREADFRAECREI